MKVSLVNHTPNPEAFVAFIARVSNPSNQSSPNYAKLIKYLIKNGHWSPFEHSYFTFEIQTSRAIAAQILRHRSFTFQEFSQRYSIAENIEPIELRAQATKNRQSSTEVIDHYSAIVDDVIHDSHMAYMRLLDLGVAKESARFVLPLATTTTLYMTGSIRSYIHYLALRTDEHTQKEHRLIANEIEIILRQYLPTVFAALDSIKADKERDELLLTLLRDYKLTDAEFLKRLLETDISIGLQNKA